MKLSRTKATLKEEPIFRILLFIFILFLLVAFIIGRNEFLSKLLEFKIDHISQASALALACAINSEAAGYINDYTCENSEITNHAGSVTIEPLYTFDDAINAIEAGKNNPTAMMIRDMKRVKRKVENIVTGLFGIELAYAEEKPVAYRFGISVVVCANSTLLSKDALWSNPASKDEKITEYYSQLNTPEFKCKVFNFDLKQHESGKVEFGERIKPKYYDPDVIIYYNSFPEGEEQAWLESEEAADLFGSMVLAGFLNVGGGIAGKAFKALKKLNFLGRIFGGEGKVLSRIALKSCTEGLEGFAKTLRKDGDEILAESFEKWLKNKGVSENVAKEAAEKLQNAIRNGEDGSVVFREIFGDLNTKGYTLSIKEMGDQWKRIYEIVKGVKSGELDSKLAVVVLKTDNKIASTIAKDLPEETLEKIKNAGSKEEAMGILKDALNDETTY